MRGFILILVVTSSGDAHQGFGHPRSPAARSGPGSQNQPVKPCAGRDLVRTCSSRCFGMIRTQPQYADHIPTTPIPSCNQQNSRVHLSSYRSAWLENPSQAQGSGSERHAYWRTVEHNFARFPSQLDIDSSRRGWQHS